MTSMFEDLRKKLRALVASPRVAIVAVGIGVVLNLPSVPTGWYLDDLVHRAQFLEVDPTADSSDMTHRMYDFLSGDPEEVLAFKDLGVLPWWASDHLRIRFWRPLSSFTHVIDYTQWPDSGLLMHAHNVAWLAWLLAWTAILYRRLIAIPFVAGLAALLYALDDAHGMPVAFLANRNALVAASFGVLTLWSHDRFRRDGWKPGAVLSPLAFVAALLAGESGIGIAPYLLGYALFMEPKSGVSRIVSILPHAVLGIVWLAAYRAGGYGTSGSEFYLDPIGQPAAWLSQFLIRAPLLLLGQWLLPPSSFAFAWTPAQTLGVAAFGMLFLVLLFSLLLWPILREDPAARFFAAGMLLAVVPITAGFPHDRLLFFVGMGGMALLAMLLVRLFDRDLSTWRARLFGWALIVVHVVIAAPLQLAMSTSVSSQEPIYANPPRSLPDDPRLEAQRLVIVNAPNTFYGQYTLIIRRFDSKPAPRSILMLAPGTTSLTLERSAAHALSIEAKDGWLGSPFDNVYRDSTERFPTNYQVGLSDVEIRVVALTDDGRPKRVLFTFERELEDDSLRWVRYEDGNYVPFEPPAVGQTDLIEAVPFSLIDPPAERSSESLETQ
jgi:hypothetical protein